jgi:hypothetical protein
MRLSKPQNRPLAQICMNAVLDVLQMGQKGIYARSLLLRINNVSLYQFRFIPCLMQDQDRLLSFNQNPFTNGQAIGDEAQQS